MQIAMIQDKIVPLAELDPRYLDRGIYFADGVYEVVRSYNGRLFALSEHLERFSRSLKEIAIFAVDIEGVRQKVQLAFEHANITDAKIYFHITRGSELRNHTGGSALKPNFFLTVTQLPDCGQDKENGIAVTTFPDWRWKRCDIKSLNLLANVLARMDAEKKNAKEAILVNEKGQITEGAGSAFFAVITGQKKLLTRRLGPEILPSITRQIVMQIAESAGLSVSETAITPDQAKEADELFIAVTTKDIVPVVKFDDKIIGSGKPGKCTKILIEKFRRFIAEHK
jgi:D-alanine transaminase